MSVHPDQLMASHEVNIVSQRRIEDGVWDFLHFDSPKRESWITSTIQLVISDLAELLPPEYTQQILDLGAGPPRNEQYAFWFFCVGLYQEMHDFLYNPDNVATPNLDTLVNFIQYMLPQHCEGFIQHKQWDTCDAFVRFVRVEYVFSTLLASVTQPP